MACIVGAFFDPPKQGQVPGTLRIKVDSTRLQRDSLNPPEAADAEIVFWKRVKAHGLASDSGKEADFTLLLDLRSRLMQVRLETDDIHPQAVAQALINEMIWYSMVPLGSLFVYRSSMHRTTEWGVRDAEHVSGLIHRLREAKEFPARLAAPAPPGLGDILNRLFDSVNENVLDLHAYRKAMQQRIMADLDQRFDLSAWETLRARLLELSEETQLHLNLAKFFEAISEFGQVTKSFRLTLPISSGPVRASLGITPAPLSYLNRLTEPTMQLGFKILRENGREFVLPPQLRD